MIQQDLDTKQQTELEVLTQLGDLLDATDDVQEENFVGFNKPDKAVWPMTRGNVAAMKTVLYKYQRQLRDRFGDEIVDSITWTVDEEELRKAKDLFWANQLLQAQQAVVRVTIEETGYGLALESSKRLSRDRFMVFIQATKAIPEGKCYPARNYLWVVPGDTDFEPYRVALASVNIVLGEIPVLPPIFLDGGEVAPTARPTTVKIRLRDDGIIAISHPFSADMNAAYKNAEETSGIIGFDWDTKERLVGAGELNDLDEVLAAIRKIHPFWTIGYSFDIEVYRNEHAALINERRNVIPSEVAALLRDGIRPLPYQLEGYSHYKRLDGNALNGDDMGLGKTFQTLLYGAVHGRRLVVICPKNVRRQWIQETAKFFVPGTYRGFEIDAKTPVDINLSQYNLVTINYEILYKFKDAILDGGFDTLVVDESHRIKNPDAGITQLILSIGPLFAHRICLSGTPVKNKKRELFTQSELVCPGAFRDESELSWMTYFQAKERIKNFFFRRTKKNELKDLPGKFRSIIEVSSHGLPDWEEGMQVGELSRLKSELALAKVPLTVDFVKGILDGSDSKVIVYSDSDDAAEAIAAKFGSRAVLHVGATPHEKREERKTIFCDENSDVRVFVATTGSAREGLNLTVADKIVFNDLPWTPADLNQAEDRANRYGQKNLVNVYWISAAENRFDSNAVQLLFAKMAVYEKVINGKKPTEEESKLLRKSLESVFAKEAA